jgi:hypothetical protein
MDSPDVEVPSQESVIPRQFQAGHRGGSRTGLPVSSVQFMPTVPVSSGALASEVPAGLLAHPASPHPTTIPQITIQRICRESGLDGARGRDSEQDEFVMWSWYCVVFQLLILRANLGLILTRHAGSTFLSITAPFYARNANRGAGAKQQRIARSKATVTAPTTGGRDKTPSRRTVRPLP